MKKNKKLCVVLITYTDGKKQINCFMSYDFANNFAKYTKSYNATNIKNIRLISVDAIFPIVNYAENE